MVACAAAPSRGRPLTDRVAFSPVAVVVLPLVMDPVGRPALPVVSLKPLVVLAEPKVLPGEYRRCQRVYGDDVLQMIAV